MITLSSSVSASENQLSCDLGGEAAVLSLRSGALFGLNELGAIVWDLLRETRRVVDIRDVILKDYDVRVDRCEADLLRLLQTMHAENLIEVRD